MVQPGDEIVLPVTGTVVKTIDTRGHTIPHYSFYMPSLSLAFTGDALFSLGCGRIFEGTFSDSYSGLKRLSEELPDDCWLCCGHEYTKGNVKFTRGVMEKFPEVRQITIEAKL